MKFTLDEAQTVPAGQYNYVANVGGGDVTLSISLNNEPFVAIGDGAFPADSAGLITLATCRVKAGLTGDATFLMSKA